MARKTRTGQTGADRWECRLARSFGFQGRLAMRGLGCDGWNGLMLRVCAAALLAAPLATTAGPAARAADITPAVVYSIGEKFDGSFNEAAYRGAERFKTETKINYRDFVVTNETQFEQAHRR